MTAKTTEQETILQLKNVTKEFSSGSRLSGGLQVTKAVNNISLEVKRGEVLGLVGESGCGKSTLARLIMRLIDPTDGNIIFDNMDLTKLKEKQMRAIRRDIQMIFQDPFSSLNPRKTVREILSKAYKVYGIPYTTDTVEETMRLVGLNPAYIDRYPHEFSGGQRQRIGIGRSITLSPKVLICDEPVSALDISVQAQILNLLNKLKAELNLTYIFISHDLSVVHHISDRIAVMYLGNIVELRSKEAFYQSPFHPYSNSLLQSIPIANPYIQRNREKIILKGEPPSPINLPTGCPFHSRCPVAQEICSQEKPILQELSTGEAVACHFPLIQ